MVRKFSNTKIIIIIIISDNLKEFNANEKTKVTNYTIVDDFISSQMSANWLVPVSSLKFSTSPAHHLTSKLRSKRLLSRENLGYEHTGECWALKNKQCKCIETWDKPAWSGEQ